MKTGMTTSELNALMPTDAVVHRALDEAREAMKKHGPAVGDPVRACGILTEEIGESMEQALRLTSNDPNEHCGQPTRDRLVLLEHELAQVAGYAMLQLENIRSGRMIEWLSQHKPTQS